MSNRSRVRDWAVIMALGLVSLAGCGVETNTFTDLTIRSTNCPGCEDVVAVRVDPAQSTISVGGTVQLTAEPVDNRGVVINNRSIHWVSSDEDIAKTTTAGLISGLAVGSVTISASTGGITGSASVTVVATAN